jgi:Ca2+-binding RTX toxin-like protein
MHGGPGHDLYYVDNASDSVVENPNEGNDTVHSVITHTLAADAEGLVLLGVSAIHGTGNALGNSLVGNTAANHLLGLDGNDVMTGGGGNDTLNGGIGADRMLGGTGNDFYYVDNTLDAVVEKPSDGTDTVYSSVTYTLTADVEILALLGLGPITATGNGLHNTVNGNIAANSLFGLEGNDTLNGGPGTDRMLGGTGDDLYYVDNALDAIVEQPGEGYDTVKSTVTHALAGDVERLDLMGILAADGTGNSLDNLLNGNSAVNRVDGGGGVDRLFGGAGDDVFLFRAGQAAGDSVLDFGGNGSAAGDMLNFIGFGAGATLTAAAPNDWLITYGGGAMAEMIRLAGVTSLDGTDYAFV